MIVLLVQAGVGTCFSASNVSTTLSSTNSNDKHAYENMI